MREYLPGNLQDRLKELREKNGYDTRQELAEILKVDKSTYGRIESGDTKTINSDMLITLAKLYNVTTDYILGISDVPERTYFDIGELGLSVESAKNLYNDSASKLVIDHLLQNGKFLLATQYMETFFEGVATETFTTSNAVYDFAFDLTTGLIKKGKVPHDKTVKDLRTTLKANKVQPESYQLSRIQSQVMGAVREVKQRVSGEVSGFAREQFNSEVLDSIKEDMNRIIDFGDYSFEEKKQLVIDAVKAAVKKNSDYSGEMKERIDKSIEVILSGLIDIWK